MAPGNVTSSKLDTPDGGTPPRRAPAKTILLFSLALTPLAILPYVLVRRHVLSLSKEIADLRKGHWFIIKEMKTDMQEMSEQRAAATELVLEMLKKHRTLLAGVRSEVEAHRTQTDLNRDVTGSMDNRLSELTETMKEMNREAGIRGSELKNMLSVANAVAKENEAKAQGWRDSMMATMEMLREEKQRRDDTSAALGRSLADIASFMQEVEIRQGWTPRPDDGRGIERTRGLAKRMLDEMISTQKQHTEEMKPGPAGGSSAESTEKHT